MCMVPLVWILFWFFILFQQWFQILNFYITLILYSIAYSSLNFISTIILYPLIPYTFYFVFFSEFVYCLICFRSPFFISPELLQLLWGIHQPTPPTRELLYPKSSPPPHPPLLIIQEKNECMHRRKAKPFYPKLFSAPSPSPHQLLLGRK